MEKNQLIKFANRLHKESPCPDKRRAVTEVLIYAFNPRATVEETRNKLAQVVKEFHGEYNLTNNNL